MGLAETLTGTAPIPKSCPRQILVQHLAPWGTSALQHKEDSRIQKSLSKSSNPSNLQVFKSSIIKSLINHQAATGLQNFNSNQLQRHSCMHRNIPSSQIVVRVSSKFQKERKNFQNARTIYAYKIFFSKSC